MTVRRAPYQPDQEISDYTARDLATSSAITGDFTTDSLKYGFGPTSLSAEDHWIDHFLPGPNINPHDDPAYDEPYVQCESNYDCPNPARTGPFNYSGGYIGKITACRECWQAILEMYEEEYQEGVVQPSGTAWQDEWAAEDDYDPMTMDAESITDWNHRVVRALEGHDTKVAGKLRVGDPQRGMINVVLRTSGLVFDPAYRQRSDHWKGDGDYLIPELEGWEYVYREPLLREVEQILIQNGVDDAHVSVGEKGHVHVRRKNQFAAEDDYDATYGKAQAKIRRRLKKELMGEATMGTKAGQWSARKSQELKRRYEAACERAGLKPYRGSKTAKQRDLSDWSDQDWRTSSGGKSSVTGEPYFPARAVQALKDRDLYAKAKRQKAAATRAGKQRATYSDDIRAVVARYRAEDPSGDIGINATGSLSARIAEISRRMDAIVQDRYGGDYDRAERDREYLDLAREHSRYSAQLLRLQRFWG